MPLPVPIPLSRLEEIAVKFGTPFQLYDESGIRSTARGLLNAFGSHFPGFKQFYAVKALPNPAILKILIQEGCGLDCSSVAELHIAKELGVPGNLCMYTSNYTSKSDLACAFDQGVIMNLDDISLVDSLVAVRGKCPELISFRLNPGLGRTDSETVSNVLGGPSAKFGVAPFQIVDAYRKAIAAGSTRFGIHMMTGSCVMNSEYWNDTVSVLMSAISDIQRELGISFEFINIGGGLGIPYKLDVPPLDVFAISKQISDFLHNQWKKTPAGMKGEPQPNLYMENGRYITGPHGWLVSRCEVIKNTWQRYYGLDACMANLMRPGMYGSYHYITVPAKEDGPREIANVVGTLCENNDWFAKNRDIPVAEVGDLFVIHDTGAHSHSMGFQYNGKLRAPEILLREDGSESLIRHRESVASLYANTVMPDDFCASVPEKYPYKVNL